MLLSGDYQKSVAFKPTADLVSAVFHWLLIKEDFSVKGTLCGSEERV